MPGRDDARIAHHQRPPRPQLARQFPERIDLVRAEDDPRAGLEVEGNHAMRSAEFGVRTAELKRAHDAHASRRCIVTAHASHSRTCVIAHLTRERRQLLLRQLVGPGAEQEVDDVAFVRLQPVELDGGDRADVEPVDVDGVGQLRLPLLVLGDRRADQRRADLREHLAPAGIRRP